MNHLETVKKLLENQGLLEYPYLITEATTLDDLKMDSLEFAEVIVSLEEKVMRLIPNKVANKWQSVGDIVKWMDTK